MIQERNIPKSVILLFVTCGIYGIYWYYNILKDLYTATNQPDTSTRDVILSIVTCGIYGIYISYQMGLMLNQARIQNGLPEKNDAILYLLLSIFGLQIVVYILVQNEINTWLTHTDTGNTSTVHIYTDQDTGDHNYGYKHPDDDNDQSS